MMAMDLYANLQLYPTTTTLPVRFLRLFPANDPTTDIKCELFLGSLVGTIDYEALSYTWGSPGNPVIITVQGRPHPATRNLAAALQRLRQRDTARVLWVDALCINQTSDAEKSYQVAQMRHVYTSERNKQVVIWLGEEGSARTALDFLEKIRLGEEYNAKYAADSADLFPGSTDVERMHTFVNLSDKLDRAISDGMGLQEFLDKVATPAERDFYTYTKSQKWTDWDNHPVKGIESLFDGYEAERAACEALFARPWWSRTWILQEAIHARDAAVHIGDLDPIPIDDLCQMAACYQRYTNMRTGQLRHRTTAAGAAFAGDRLSWFPDAATNFPLWLLISGTARTTPDTILTLRAKYAAEGEAAAAGLRELLLQLRSQDATDPRDKVYGLLGFSANEYGVDPDYSLSKEELFTVLTRRMMKNVMYVLLWVEAPTRKIGVGSLPSWVPDHSTRQTYRTITMNQQWYKFSANKDFPPPGSTGEPHLSQSPNEKVLAVRGICVGEITEIRDVPISPDLPLAGDNVLRLFGYKTGNDMHPIDHDDGNPGTIRSASWGPYHAAVGDLIVVTPGCSMPLVLRASAGNPGQFLLVGACWLIDSELQDVNKLEVDPGFSAVMFGSACSGVSLDDITVYHLV